MKNRKILLILLSSLFLSGCFRFTSKNNNQINDAVSSIEQEINHSYDEIKDSTIFWSAIFNQPESNYYVYLYSITCMHCNSIKNQMIEKAITSPIKIYFIVSSPEHNISDLIDKYEIIDNLNDLYIKGYPSLLKLNNKKVVLNLAGTTLIRAELNLN